MEPATVLPPLERSLPGLGNTLDQELPQPCPKLLSNSGQGGESRVRFPRRLWISSSARPSRKSLWSLVEVIEKGR
jgi:hypothetical protein